jgi:mono/diheme cytochrome c family protein
MKRRLPFIFAATLLASGAAIAQDAGTQSQCQRGEYLVTIGLCNDCHTPLTTGPNGPEPDMSRMLSGHPQDISITAPAQVAEPWAAAASPTLTAWSGPWGVSFTANLTPDPETGVFAGFLRGAVHPDPAHRPAPRPGTALSCRPCRGLISAR